jgi:hypothetical protein
MRNAQPPMNPTPGNNPSPSVPISLYREVTSELQSTKATVDSLKTHNQQLVEQNQQLRVEIERVVQTALHLRQVADSYKLINPRPVVEAPGSNLELHFDPAPAKPLAKAPAKAQAVPQYKPPKAEPAESAAPERLFTEQESQPRRSTQAEKSPELSGWWLALIIFMIVVTAFGMGFVVLSSLLPKNGK